jgi:hypothetical protein
MLGSSSRVLPGQSAAAAGGVAQLERTRRKEYKKERERLASQKRMGPVIESMEQAAEEQEQAEYEAEFDSYLREGMELILGENAGGIGGGVRFGSFSMAFDATYWNRVLLEPEGSSNTEESDSDGDESNSETDETASSDSDTEDEPEYKLVMKSGVKPAAAIDYLFDNLTEWALDCAEAIQVARWYAMRHAMGAKKFNSAMPRMEFALKAHGSSGLGSTGMYSRLDTEGFYAPGASLTFRADGSSTSRNVTASAESIVRRAPVGSRVMLTCDDESAAGTDFENENVVKVGPDLFAAHPLGIGTLDHIIEEVAKTALDIDEADEITDEMRDKIAEMRKTIYISEIELIRKR